VEVELNNNELNRVATFIWSILNTRENSDKSRLEQIDLIKPLLLELYKDSLTIGRKQILNNLKDSISDLENK